MAKSKNKKREYSVREMAEALFQLAPELEEAYTRADIELALDDRGWIGSANAQAAEPDAQTRKQTIVKSRMYWRKDPLAKQAVRLWTDYAYGKGMTFKAEDDSVQEDLEAFAKKNRRYLSSRGTQRLSKKLLVDGDLFILMFDGDPMEMRLLEPLQITDIISDPDDEERVLGYRRETKTGKVLFYLDWQADPSDKLEDPVTRKPAKAERGVKMYHAKFDDLGKFGNGLLSSTVDWSSQHRRFMEARVAITQALAKFAWKGLVKGGQGALNAVKERLQSSIALNGPTSLEKNPTPSAASAWLQNNGVDLTPMPRTTGAGDAKSDGDQLKLMHCAGTGIMLHYFGDPSTGNLATATAMELPMLKQFGAYQEAWTEIWRDIFSIALGEDPEDPDVVIDIDLPAILDRDLTQLASFLSTVSAVFPEVKVPEVLQMVLGALGINNLEDVMKKIAEEKKKQEAKAEQDAKMQNTLTLAKANSLDPASAEKLAESYADLANQIRELNEKLG